MYIDRHAGDTRQPTHLDMSGHLGGQIHCRGGKEAEKFLECYSQSVRHNQPQYLIELRTEVFPFFMDVDEKRCDVVDWDKYDRFEYVRTIQRSTARFFPSVDSGDLESLLQCIICAPDKEVQHSYNDMGDPISVKIGIHFHFPNLLVNVEHAKLIRSAAVAALEKDFPFNRSILPEGWDKVIDSTVYDANGLRMLRSMKRVNCPEKCSKRAKQRHVCQVCDGQGRVEYNRSYIAKHVISGGGQVDEEETGRIRVNFDDENIDPVRFLYGLSRVSIRTKEGAVVDPRFKRFTGCPSSRDEIDGGKKNTPNKSRVHQSDQTGARVIGITKNKQALHLTPMRIGALKTIFTRINPIYENIEIKDAVWLGSGKTTKLCVRVEGDGSNWCRNKGADHDSNTIYFILTPDKAYQCCFSSKEYMGQCCRTYNSPSTPLVRQEGVKLFESAGKMGSTLQSLYGVEPIQPHRQSPSAIADGVWDTSHDYSALENLMMRGMAKHYVESSEPFLTAPGTKAAARKGKKRKKFVMPPITM